LASITTIGKCATAERESKTLITQIYMAREQGPAQVHSKHTRPATWMTVAAVHSSLTGSVGNDVLMLLVALKDGRDDHHAPLLGPLQYEETDRQMCTGETGVCRRDRCVPETQACDIERTVG